jgi:hypothetical protein
MSLRKRIYGLLVSTVVALAGVVMTAAPASAGTCNSPGCGGVVDHLPSSVGCCLEVANCWSDAYGWVYYGDSPPCTQNRYSSNIPPTSTTGTMFYIFPGETTATLRYYYDTDAFKVRANCIMNFYDGSTIDRRGRGPAWYKITNLNYKSVTQYRCF